MSTDSQFKAMTDNIMSEEANKLLDKYLVRVDNWKSNQRMDGIEPTTADLIRKLVAEKSDPKHVAVALSAALWRLLGDSGE